MILSSIVLMYDSATGIQDVAQSHERFKVRCRWTEIPQYWWNIYDLEIVGQPIFGGCQIVEESFRKEGLCCNGKVTWHCATRANNTWSTSSVNWVPQHAHEQNGEQQWSAWSFWSWWCSSSPTTAPLLSWWSLQGRPQRNVMYNKIMQARLFTPLK